MYNWWYWDTFFEKNFKKLILLEGKLGMNCINNVKNYKYLFLVKKPDKIKNLKMVRKNVLTPAVIHTTINNKKKTY